MTYLEFGKAICYSGYRKGQNPKGEVPSKEQIEEDIRILVADGYKYLRMYDPNLHARRVLEVIKENDLPIKVIIGIDSDNEVNNKDCPFEDQDFTEEELQAHIRRNDGELDKLIEMAKEYKDLIAAVSVGNENTPVWTAHKVSEERLVSHVRKLKANLDIPVTFCEGYFDWPALETLSKEVDIISVHTYPYHYGCPIEDAVSDNRKHYKDMVAKYPDKQVIITELGWSSRSTGEKPQATLENAKRYVEEVQKWIEEDHVIAFIFEAFDELWKGDCPEASECNFGLYNEERKPKYK